MPPVSSLTVGAVQAARAVSYYVPLPRPLLQALRDNALAIGVYALIARVYRATGAPVPLSPADVAAYDPSISRQAAGRALGRRSGSTIWRSAPRAGRATPTSPPGAV